MKVWLKRIAIGAIGMFVLAQFVGPARTNPPVDRARTIHALTQITPQASAILERACRDCHSHESRWPWYAYVAPVKWWVIDHVNHGRSHFNYSDWAKYDSKRALSKLNEVCGEVKEGAMPLPAYLPMHPDARLSPDDVKTLCDWTDAERTRIRAASENPASPPAATPESKPK